MMVAHGANHGHAMWGHREVRARRRRSETGAAVRGGAGSEQRKNVGEVPGARRRAPRAMAMTDLVLARERKRERVRRRGRSEGEGKEGEGEEGASEEFNRRAQRA